MKFKINHIHRWDIKPSDAILLQNKLNKEIREFPLKKEIKKIAAIDVSYKQKTDKVFVAVIIFDIEKFKVVNSIIQPGKNVYPYIPGLLSFREAPPVLNVLEKIDEDVDLFLFDAQGRAHPRGLGLASHIGLFIDRPTIGCAKSRLCGYYEIPPDRRGGYSFLYSKNNEVIGVVLRTRQGIKPVFVSVGNNITLNESIKIVLRVTGRYKIPEPLRLAHLLSKSVW